MALEDYMGTRVDDGVREKFARVAVKRDKLDVSKALRHLIEAYAAGKISITIPEPTVTMKGNN